MDFYFSHHPRIENDITVPFCSIDWRIFFFYTNAIAKTRWKIHHYKLRREQREKNRREKRKKPFSSTHKQAHNRMEMLSFGLLSMTQILMHVARCVFIFSFPHRRRWFFFFSVFLFEYFCVETRTWWWCARVLLHFDLFVSRDSFTNSQTKPKSLYFFSLCDRSAFNTGTYARTHSHTKYIQLKLEKNLGWLFLLGFLSMRIKYDALPLAERIFRFHCCHNNFTLRMASMHCRRRHRRYCLSLAPSRVYLKRTRACVCTRHISFDAKTH